MDLGHGHVECRQTVRPVGVTDACGPYVVALTEILSRDQNPTLA